MSFNTGNELGSLDERDLYDNAINLDKAMNSTDPTWRDRFNVEKPTIDAALKSAGFMPAGFDFVTGGTLQPGDRNKAVYNPAPNGDNNWYRWNSVFPKEIVANSQPNPKDENNWVPVDTDKVIREDLLKGPLGLINDLFILKDLISVKDFGAKGDSVTDDTLAIQNATDYCFNNKKRLFFPAGKYRITSTISVKLGDHYSVSGSYFYGDGRSSSLILADFGNYQNPIPILNLIQGAGAQTSVYNFQLSDMTLQGVDPDKVLAGIVSEKGISGLNIARVGIIKTITSIWLKNNAWINSFVDITMSPRDYGIRMDNSGTTNWFDECFVWHSDVCAYKLRGGYSSIGSLAADDCIGTIYDLNYFSGNIGSLGCESPVKTRTPRTILNGDRSTLVIGTIRGYRVCPTDGREFTCVYVGSGNITIGHITIDQNDQNDTNLIVNGQVVKGYRGKIVIGNLKTPKDGNSSDKTELVFSKTELLNTFTTISTLSGKFSIEANGKPFIGMGRKEDINVLTGISDRLPKRANQTIYFDAAGGPSGSGIGNDFDSGRDRWASGASQGSLMIEVDPALRGCMGYAVTQAGVDMNGTKTARIPIVEVVDLKTSLPTNELWEGRSVFVRELHKKLTYSTYGSAGWYDESGVKV